MVKSEAGKKLLSQGPIVAREVEVVVVDELEPLVQRDDGFRSARRNHILAEAADFLGQRRLFRRQPVRHFQQHQLVQHHLLGETAGRSRHHFKGLLELDAGPTSCLPGPENREASSFVQAAIASWRRWFRTSSFPCSFAI